MKASFAVSILSLSALTCLAAQSQETPKLELRMKPGESATYTLRAQTTTEYLRRARRGPQKQTVSFTSDMKVLLRCVSTPAEGVMNVEITYPDFRMETAVSEGGKMTKIVSDREGARSYLDGKLQDSATWDELEKQGRPNLRKLFGSTVGFTLDKTGKVVSVTAPENLTNRLPGVDVKQFFQHQVIFPDVPVVPGAEWNQKTEREAPAGASPLSRQIVTDETSYKYERNETVAGRQCVRIAMEVATRPKEKIANLEEFKQTTKGWSLVALDNGQLVESELALSQQMKATLGGIATELRTTGTVKTNLVQPPAAEKPSPEEKSPTQTK